MTHNHIIIKHSISHNAGYRTDFRFNGKELDNETDMYYYGARYYTPSILTWHGATPLAENYYATSPYAFCGGNPVRYSDPTGMAGEETPHAALPEFVVTPDYDDLYPVRYFSSDLTAGGWNQYASQSLYEPFTGSMISEGYTSSGSYNNHINNSVTISNPDSFTDGSTETIATANMIASGFSASTNLRDGIIAASGQDLSKLGKMGKWMGTCGKVIGVTGSAIAFKSGYDMFLQGHYRGVFDMAVAGTTAITPFLMGAGLISNPVGWTIIGITTIYGVSTALYDISSYSE